MSVRCGLSAEDCSAVHWCPSLGGHRERDGWRADCPICGAPRALAWDVPGKSIRWKSWCAQHDRDALRPVLAERLPQCLPGRGAGRVPIDHGELAALALADMPAMTLRLRLLRLAGMGTQEALDKLGVRREHRSRVIAGRTGAPKLVQNRRT